MIFQIIRLGITEFYNAKDQAQLEENLLKIDYDLEETEIIEVSAETAKNIEIYDEENPDTIISLYDLAEQSEDFFPLATNDI